MTKGELVGPTDNTTKLGFKIDGRFIDPNQRLNHVAWDIYLEEGRIKTAETFGITINGVPVEAAFLQRTRIDYKDQIKEGDEINIITTTRKEGDLVVFEQKIPGTDSTKPIGEASTTYGQPDTSLTISPEKSLLDLPLELDEEFFLLKGKKINHLAAPVKYNIKMCMVIK